MEHVARMLLGTIAFFYFLLPRWGRAGCEAVLSSIFRMANWRRKVIEQNIQIALKNGSVTKDFGARRVYDHMAQIIFEILILFGPSRSFLRKEFELEGVEHWELAKARGKGALMLSSHLGNWEFAAAKGAEHGMSVMMVTKRLKPEWVHRLMEKCRARIGLKATYEPRTFRDVLRQLKGNNVVGFVIDQYAGPPVGVRVPFFGIPVGTQSAIAMIVKRTGATVLPVMNYYDFARGKRIVRIDPPIDWQEHSSPEYEIAVNTFRFSQAIERQIVSYPSEWLWTHRRFKGDLTPLKPGEWTEGRART